MEDKILYTGSKESEDQNRINEPEVGYSLQDEAFEKDWKRGISVDEFRVRVLEKLRAIHG